MINDPYKMHHIEAISLQWYSALIAPCENCGHAAGLHCLDDGAGDGRCEALPNASGNGARDGCYCLRYVEKPE